jgi:hypothetical protein
MELLWPNPVKASPTNARNRSFFMGKMDSSDAAKQTTEIKPAQA